MMRRLRRRAALRDAFWMLNSVTILAVMMFAGCAFSPDIVMRDKDGREAVCEHVTGIGGVRTHTLLTVQRQCVEDYQRQGYERVTTDEEGKR